jgi:glycerol-3-phosphate dehydrogenase (NAD(P)+)
VSSNRVAIIGAGSWGTALACALSSAGETYVWSRDPGQVASMEAKRHNPRYLSEIETRRKPGSFNAIAKLAAALRVPLDDIAAWLKVGQ